MICLKREIVKIHRVLLFYTVQPHGRVRGYSLAVVPPRGLWSYNCQVVTEYALDLHFGRICPAR